MLSSERFDAATLTDSEVEYRLCSLSQQQKCKICHSINFAYALGQVDGKLVSQTRALLESMMVRRIKVEVGAFVQ